MSEQIHPDDELLSAYLDGEVTSEQAAEIAADTRVAPRLEQLQTVRDALSHPVVPVSPEVRDQAISAAVAYQQQRTAAPIHTRRTLLAVAASVVVVAAVLGVGLLAGRDDSATYDVASSAENESAATAAPTAAMESPADDSAPMATVVVETDESGEADEAAASGPAEEAEADSADSAIEARAAADAYAAPADIDEPMAESDDAGFAEALPAESTTALAMESDDVREQAEEAQAVDLGSLENLDALFDAVSGHEPAGDDQLTAPGQCAAILGEHLSGSGAEAMQAFTATIVERVDAVLARSAEVARLVVYAAAPDCEIMRHELEP